MVRVVKPQGVVAAYVWDYAGKMQLMRHFWNAAAARWTRWLTTSTKAAASRSASPTRSGSFSSRPG